MDQPEPEPNRLSELNPYAEPKFVQIVGESRSARILTGIWLAGAIVWMIWSVWNLAAAPQNAVALIFDGTYDSDPNPVDRLGKVAERLLVRVVYSGAVVAASAAALLIWLVFFRIEHRKVESRKHFEWRD